MQSRSVYEGVCMYGQMTGKLQADALILTHLFVIIKIIPTVGCKGGEKQKRKVYNFCIEA